MYASRFTAEIMKTNLDRDLIRGSYIEKMKPLRMSLSRGHFEPLNHRILVQGGRQTGRKREYTLLSP